MEGYSYLLEGLFFDLRVNAHDVECTIDVWVNAELQEEGRYSGWTITDRGFDESCFDEDVNGYKLDAATIKAIDTAIHTRLADAYLLEELDKQTK